MNHETIALIVTLIGTSITATWALRSKLSATGATVSIPTLTKARCVCFDGANYR